MVLNPNPNPNPGPNLVTLLDGLERLAQAHVHHEVPGRIGVGLGLGLGLEPTGAPGPDEGDIGRYREIYGDAGRYRET